MPPCTGCLCLCHLQWSIMWLKLYCVADPVSLTHLWPPSNVFWVFVISVEIAFLLSHLCVGLWLIRKNMLIFWREGRVLEFLIRVSCFNHPALLVPRHSSTGRWVWVWPKHGLLFFQSYCSLSLLGPDTELSSMHLSHSICVGYPPFPTGTLFTDQVSSGNPK